MIHELLQKFKREWLPYVFAYTAKISLRILLKTCRIEIDGLDLFLKTAEKSPCILMLWHNRLVIVSEILNTFAPQFIYTAFISKSRDGDPLAFLAKSYKSGRALRVAHDSRHTALNNMIDHLKVAREIILITPDGPRGPRYVAKQGIALAAREASASVVPFSWESNRMWTLNTWDQMRIPKPFSKIKVVFASPLSFSSIPASSLEETTILLQNALLAIGDKS